MAEECFDAWLNDLRIGGGGRMLTVVEHSPIYIPSNKRRRRIAPCIEKALVIKLFWIHKPQQLSKADLISVSPSKSFMFVNIPPFTYIHLFPAALSQHNWWTRIAEPLNDFVWETKWVEPLITWIQPSISHRQTLTWCQTAGSIRQLHIRPQLMLARSTFQTAHKFESASSAMLLIRFINYNVK